MLVLSGVLGDVSVVVTLHLEIEDVGFVVAGAAWDELLVEDLEDVFAVSVEFLLDLFLVVSQEWQVLAFWSWLNFKCS